MTEYAGLRALVIRKQRTDLSETALVTLERDIIGTSHPLVVDAPKRQYRHDYKIQNGSVLVVGGLDKPGKILSSEYDIIFVPQAEELQRSDWETLITRLSGTVLPPHMQQIIGDCNPASPLHWIMQRSLQGTLALWETYHKDNPLLWDEERQQWTPFGKEYLARLAASLTGNERSRLLDGLWLQSEGVVYSDFNSENITQDGPDNLPFDLGVDDGFVDPRAILFIQRTANRVLVFDEIYHSGHIAETCVSEVLQKCGEWFGWIDQDGEFVSPGEAEELAPEEADMLYPARLPDNVIGSHEAKELQAQFRKAGMAYRHKVHKIVEGIKVVRRLIMSGEGYRALQVNGERCPNLVAEISDGYRYPEKGSRKDSEQPVDENNHASDALRYWSWVRAGKGLEGRLFY